MKLIPLHLFFPILVFLVITATARPIEDAKIPDTAKPDFTVYHTQCATFICFHAMYFWILKSQYVSSGYALPCRSALTEYVTQIAKAHPSTMQVEAT